MSLTNYRSNGPLQAATIAAPFVANSLGRFLGNTMANFRIPFPPRRRGSAIMRLRGSGRNLRRRYPRLNRTGVSSGRGVTIQHDRTSIYRKKYMPRFKKRRWKAFRRKVNAIAEKELGSRTVVFNNTVQFQETTPGLQVHGTLALYPQFSTEAHLADLSTLVNWENDGNSTAAAGETIDETTKFIFQSGVLDMTIRNTSNDGSDPASILSDYAMEVDVYEMTMKRTAMDGPTSLNNLRSVFAVGEADTKKLDAAPIALQVIRRGCTPWDVPATLSRYGLKILKKTKLFLPSGGTATYQIRDPKRHVAPMAALRDSLGFNKPGWTRIVYLIAKPVVSLPVDLDHIPELSVGVTRKYLYKIEGMNDTRDGFSLL